MSSALNRREMQVTGIVQHRYEPVGFVAHLPDFADADPLARYSDPRQRDALDRILGDIASIPDSRPIDSALAQLADREAADAVRRDIELHGGIYDIEA